MKHFIYIGFLLITSILNGQVLIKPAVHDFGDIPESNEVISTEFKIQNTSEDTVHVIHLKPSCGCTVVLMDTSMIPPNQSISFNVEYQSEDRPGSFFKTIKIHLRNRQKIWATHIGVKGYVIPEANTNHKLQKIESISIKPFQMLFRHSFDTTGFVNSGFQKFINALTYAIDKDQTVLLQPKVIYFHDYGAHDFVLQRLKNNVAHELKRRGYDPSVVLYQIPEIEVQKKEDYLNSGSIFLSVPGYTDENTNGTYDVNLSVQKQEKDSIKILDELLSIQDENLKSLSVKQQQEAMYNLSNAIVRNHMLGKLQRLKINYYAVSEAKKVQKFMDNWKNEVEDYLKDALPEAIPIRISKPEFIAQDQPGQPFKIEVLHFQRNTKKDTVTHVFKIAEVESVQPSLPIVQFKTKDPGNGDLELFQKRRLFANFDAYKVKDDTLSIVCILQHNGYLYDKKESVILDAIEHYKVVLESIHREAERQGFTVDSKIWVQPFHLTNWNKRDQNFISVQFLSQINGTQEQLEGNENFVGFYNDLQNDSIVIAGVQSFYLDQMANAINKQGWLGISLNSYMYDDGAQSKKEIRNVLIEQTQNALQQIYQALLDRGVDPRRLIIVEEKIIVRNKPLDNVSGFGQHQPKGTMNKRFTKVVFNPSFEFVE